MKSGLQVGSWPGGPEAIFEVQQMIINTADGHNPDAIELLAAELVPQLADSGSAP